MKKLIVVFVILQVLINAGGEISFKKQREKEEKYENARLESIRNSIVQRGEENIDVEDEILELNENDMKKKRIIIQ